MAMDGLRGYLQLASGLAEMSKAKATEAASALIALTSGLSSARSGKDVQVQVQDLAEELLAAAAANRRSLIALVRSEVERAVANSPIPPDELDRARAAVAKLSADVEELRAQVLGNPAVGEVAAKLGLAGHAESRPVDPFADGGADDEGAVVDAVLTEPAPETPAPPRRRPPRQQIADRAATGSVTAPSAESAAEPPAKKVATTKRAARKSATPAAPATKATATKKTAAKTAATTSTPTKAAAKKAPAKKAPAKKTTAKKTTANKATKKTETKRANPSTGAGSSRRGT